MNYKLFLSIFLLSVIFSVSNAQNNFSEKNERNSSVMMFSDSSRLGRPWAKDPTVIFFENRYLMYYSIPPYKDENGINHGLGIGIAESNDLTNWKRIGDMNIDELAEYEKNGVGAPCALVIDDKIHLFYQTYGNGVNDAICHAFSTNGIEFVRNSTNPIFSPDGDWNCGRAIDVDVILFKDTYFLYYATRDPDFKIQMLGVATAPLTTNFNRKDWTHVSITGSILKPELDWETKCIEAPTLIEKNNNLYMFYAGGYNNDPQQIGVAVSSDGVNWERLSQEPLLKNGKDDSWNSSESGHPEIFTDIDGKTYLFYQGNNNNGHTWLLSKEEIAWSNDSIPFLVNEQ